MARFPTDRRRLHRAGAGLLMMLACGALQSAAAPGIAGTLTIEDGHDLNIDTRDGSWSLKDVVLTHDRGTLITAVDARGVNKSDGTHELDLSGKVHIEFRDAVLDAASARIVMREEQLLSINVKGSQADFSHQPAGLPRRVVGRANAIDYDGASGKVRFSGNTWYTDGRNECRFEALTYDLDDASVKDDGDPGTRINCTILLGDRERVPPPRTPDRSTAQ